MLQILRWWLIDVTRGAKHVAIPQVVIASVIHHRGIPNRILVITTHHQYQQEPSVSFSSEPCGFASGLNRHFPKTVRLYMQYLRRQHNNNNNKKINLNYYYYY